MCQFLRVFDQVSRGWHRSHEDGFFSGGRGRRAFRRQAPKPIDPVCVGISSSSLRCFRGWRSECPGCVGPQGHARTCGIVWCASRLVLLPFASQSAMAFPLNVEGRRVVPISRGSSLTQALPATIARAQFTRLHHSFSYYGLRLWPTPLTGSDTLCAVRGAVSGQVPPKCCHSNAPSAYTPNRATGVADSFHSASYQFRYLAHVTSVVRGSFPRRHQSFCSYVSREGVNSDAGTNNHDYAEKDMQKRLPFRTTGEVVFQG